MAYMTQDLIDLFNERPLVPKVLTTSDASGALNAVPKETLSAVDRETLAFADIWGDKTNKNLQDNNKAAVSIFKIDVPPIGYQVKGTFQGFQTAGPLFDNFAQEVKKMLNLDIRAVGVIKVDEVYSAAPPNPGAKLA